MSVITEQLRVAGEENLSRAVTDLGLNERRARELADGGKLVSFGPDLAVVGSETSLLIGAVTADVFAVTSGLIGDSLRWTIFERALYERWPASRLRVHSRNDLRPLGFSHILFFVEKLADPRAGDGVDIESRNAISDLDFAFVRQCAARSVYQGMTAAFPGTPITPDRLVAYLDAELPLASGRAKALIAWQAGHPVAYAAWVERSDAVSGLLFTEMWDVDSLMDLHRSGILSKLARKAEAGIAAAGGPLLMQGTVTIEPGWERVWASLERQGWKRVDDLYAKHPWDPNESVIDLTQMQLAETY